MCVHSSNDSKDELEDNGIDIMENGYEAAWQDGWDTCQKRYMDILKRFPLQCAAISHRLPLHPSQPDSVLEYKDWALARGLDIHKYPPTDGQGQGEGNEK